MTDPYVGRVSFFRVYSGSLKGDQPIYNASKKIEERAGHSFTMRGKDQQSLDTVIAGDIGALAKLTETVTGDTIADKASPIVLPTIEPPEPLLPKAIQPKTKGDEDKLMIGLHKLIEEDPALKLERNDETHQTILWGMGDAHLDVVLERLKRKFSVEVGESDFKVPYRSSLRSKADALGRHVKQSGGHGQFGVCNIRVEPLPRGEGFQFVNSVFGGSIPSQWIPSVEKGVVAAMESGVGTGFPMIDVKVDLYDGKFHSVDSSDMAFQLAGRLAMSEAMPQCQPVLLEPIDTVEIVCPTDATAKINAILSQRRGQIVGFDAREDWPGWDVVKAMLPESEIGDLIIEVRSATAGVGGLTFKFDHLQELTGKQADQAVAARRAAE
jgi:elongation factor G